MQLKTAGLVGSLCTQQCIWIQNSQKLLSSLNIRRINFLFQIFPALSLVQQNNHWISGCTYADFPMQSLLPVRSTSSLFKHWPVVVSLNVWFLIRPWTKSLWKGSLRREEKKKLACWKELYFMISLRCQANQAQLFNKTRISSWLYINSCHLRKSTLCIYWWCLAGKYKYLFVFCTHLCMLI